MKELIPITENNGKRAVSARDLHAYVDMNTRFDIWIKRMLEYGFTENIDYQCLNKNVQMPNGGTKIAIDDYALTIDCAKEISMLQRNEKGKQARHYFIEVEKKYRNQLALPQTFAEALRQLAAQVEETEHQQRLLIEQKPKVIFADAVATSTQSCLIGELAKILRQNGIEIGQNRLFDWLRANGYLCRYGEKYNQPTQKAMEMELFEVKKTSITKPNGTILITATTKVTGKGQVYFVNKLIKAS